MNYFDNLSTKICKNCNEEFESTEKQTLCDKCRTIVTTKNRLNSFKVVKQDIHCKYCKVYISSTDKKQTRVISKIIYTRVCNKCKLENRIKKSEKMKKNNPMKNKETVNKTLISKYGLIPDKAEPIYKQLGYNSFNEYMKESNPMKNEKIKNKVSFTLKRRIANGEIVYKRGINHHNFKGTRKINKAIRDELGEWRQQILEHDNFKCIECGVNNNNLHIHHVKPLYLIILNICEKNKIDSKTLKDGTHNFYFIKEEVLKYHKENNLGITLCEDCHDLIDIHYHKNKNENKKNY